VTEEMTAIAREGVTEEELTLMKDQARASILLGLEDSAGRAATLAQCEMVHGRQIPVEETLANLDAVTVQEVQDLAKEYFAADRLALVALGDIDETQFTRDRLNKAAA
jgi:predicted Zn-dependent peptidase